MSPTYRGEVAYPHLWAIALKILPRVASHSIYSAIAPDLETFLVDGKGKAFSVMT